MKTRKIGEVLVEEPEDEAGPWRDGQLLVYHDTHLVVRRGRHALPGRCMRCNAPTDRVEHARLRWQPRGRAGGVVGGIDVLARTETVEVRLPRCERCKPRVSPRAVSTVFGLLAAGLAIGGLFSPFKGSDPWPLFRCLIASAACFAVAAAAALWPREARVIYLEWPFVWLAGFSPQYLAALPPYQPRDDQPSLRRVRAAERQSLRPLRIPMALAALVAFAVGCLDLREWLHVRAVRDSPVVSGRVVTREPAKLVGGIPGARFTIRTDEAGDVYALAPRKLLDALPEEVRFRHSGDPSREVFLFEHEADPSRGLAFLWGLAAVCALLMWAFGRIARSETNGNADE